MNERFREFIFPLLSQSLSSKDVTWAIYFIPNNKLRNRNVTQQKKIVQNVIIAVTRKIEAPATKEDNQPTFFTLSTSGIAAMEVSNYNNEARVVVVPSVDSYSPTEGSLGGGTLITITGWSRSLLTLLNLM